MSLSRPVRRRLNRLIDAFGLHATTPVPIRQAVIDLGWTLVFRERIYPLYGVLARGSVRTVILVNANLTPAWQRYTIAHELGHALNGDVGGLHMLTGESSHDDLWWRRPGELAANEIAALLLMPEDGQNGATSPMDIAAAYDVPVQLVEWWSHWQAKQ